MKLLLVTTTIFLRCYVGRYLKVTKLLLVTTTICLQCYDGHYLWLQRWLNAFILLTASGLYEIESQE